MSIALDDLVTYLEADVPARDSVPSEGQYEKCVKDAVADYGRRRPLEKITTLDIVNGTAVYDLPTDFLRLIKLERSTIMDGNVIISDEGIIPVSSTYEERYTIAGVQITFYPTPTYTLSRDLRYVAKHVLDESDEYPDLLDEDAEIVLLKAQALALQKQANAMAPNAWKYGLGDESVDKTNQVRALREQAEFIEKQYLEAVRAAVGTRCVRADYDVTGH